MISNALFDISFDHSLTEMDGAGQVILGVLALFTHIHDKKLLVAIKLRFDFSGSDFTNALLGIPYDLQKTFGVLMSHKKPLVAAPKRGLFDIPRTRL